MSARVLQPINGSPSVSSRKRTMSFSSPQPTKSARTLQRTGSFLSLSDMDEASSSTSHLNDLSVYTRPPRPHRERRRSVTRTYSDHQQPARTQPARSAAAAPTPSKCVVHAAYRSSSPLAPTRSALPPRTAFPRSKPEPDLYRVAIITRMRNSPEGQKILHMGPRLAFSIYNATRELERIVASQRDGEGDIYMGDTEQLLSTSWVVLPQDDWEMVDN